MTTQESRQQPWDPQPREGAEAFAAFRAYLEMVPKRNIPAAAKAVGKSCQQLYKWSSRHQWLRRAAAWVGISVHTMTKRSKM